MYYDLREPGDFDTLVRTARLERGVAVSEVIGSLITATMLGLGRALDSFKSNDESARAG
jgi:hypothetical protein